MQLRLASVWFVYMAGMGLVFPFQALYFRENAGLAGFQLGLILSVRPLMGMVFQPVFGQVADRTGQRSRVLAAIALGNALGFCLLARAVEFETLLLTMALTAAFGTSFMPLATSVTMAGLGERATQDFGKVRVAGTCSFLALVVAFPLLLDRIQAARGWVAVEGGPSEPGLELIFYGAAIASVLGGLLAFRLPASGALRARARRGDLRAVLRHRPYRRILLFAFLAYLFLTAPIQFFPVLVRERGGDLELISRLWIPMIALEIPLVFYSGKMLRRFGSRGLVAIGVGADGLRWLLSAWTGSTALFYGLQLLHGVSVGCFMVGLALYVEQAVPERLRSSGQSGLGMVGMSLAGFLSNILGGLLVDLLGIEALYVAGGGAALVLLASMPLWMPRPVRPGGSAASPAGDQQRHAEQA